LINFRKGVEIIRRMFGRTMERKKAFSPEMSEPLGDDWDSEHPPANTKSIGEFVGQLSQSFHTLRDSNYHANQDAKSFSEKCNKAIVNAAIGLLSAIDGIDAGLQNESEIRSRLAPFEEGEDNCSDLITSWFQAYHHLNNFSERFFNKTGIEGHSVDPGTPFDPETMEPQGIISNPELNDDDVAAVMRRGFSLNGKSIRPILVEVVRNS
ncbi:nucleotide exchange factor GrpE, partial [Mariniblastus sp.]|nr:nucleotide exchange factor GrpE [Mariniblastus sp.]